MKIVGADGPVVLVDLEREENGVALACVVRAVNGEPTTVSPGLPLYQFTEAGIYDQEVKPGLRDRVLAAVRRAQPQPGI